MAKFATWSLREKSNGKSKTMHFTAEPRESLMTSLLKASLGGRHAREEPRPAEKSIPTRSACALLSLIVGSTMSETTNDILGMGASDVMIIIRRVCHL